ncbi:putative J domain-containing protein [Acanthamoeba polyphaga moumouvirus]|uniref:Putative J domain-containing protein n=1 Tax=Acanthamoeba polyphaga moumouvirus TaxID=1269028 RepID=L7RCE5_9VIRU|nr:putative J domain-containing protein [Acanthamoeba polyphaga moumouvirus]AGC01906.1 putative J domain-containing protein [Acanthamoeba polyphaga moumouvirus]AQN68266.1 putative J domain protein [Saudi moumouvirus]
MSTQYKQKNDIPDLYNILGLTIEVCKDPKCDDIIRKAHRERIMKWHPDKHTDKKNAEEIFQLLNMAYDILKDEKQRNEYNNRLAINKQSSSDFFKLKKGTTEYMESLGEYKEPSKQQKLAFEQQMKSLDDKHGYDDKETKAIPQDKAKEKLQNLSKIRTEQDVNYKPEKLFDDGKFDLKKFNAAFDKMHQKNNNNSITSYNGVPSAWNDIGGTTNFSNFDSLDNIYVDDDNRFDTSRQLFGNVDFGSPLGKITKDDIINLDDADYVDGHKVLGEDYYRNLKTKLQERKLDADNFDKMKFKDYKKDDTAGYGIFDQLGFDFSDRLCLDVDEESLSSKFDRLMAERQKDIDLFSPKTQSNKNKSFKGR